MDSPTHPRPRFWTRDSSILLGGFFLVIFLIVYIWWPLAEEVLSYIDWSGEWWRYMDWLLLGVFFFMSVTIVARADLNHGQLMLDQFLFMRPIPGWSNHKTPIDNLYLCGSGVHGGGGVSGAAGRNVVKALK